jgi:hypothetical protein
VTVLCRGHWRECRVYFQPFSLRHLAALRLRTLPLPAGRPDSQGSPNREVHWAYGATPRETRRTGRTRLATDQGSSTRRITHDTPNGQRFTAVVSRRHRPRRSHRKEGSPLTTSLKAKGLRSARVQLSVACIGDRQLEHLWSRAVANGGNRWQIELRRNRRNQAKPLPLVATGCGGNAMVRRGRRFESVRGLAKSPAQGFFRSSFCVFQDDRSCFWSSQDVTWGIEFFRSPARIHRASLALAVTG